jgi:hypothetical protein
VFNGIASRKIMSNGTMSNGTMSNGTMSNGTMSKNVFELLQVSLYFPQREYFMPTAVSPFSTLHIYAISKNFLTSSDNISFDFSTGFDL